jgi:hypothetical protein
MLPRSLALGTVLLTALGFSACASNPDAAGAPRALTSQARDGGELVRNLHATPRYRGGPPLGPIHYRRQPRG